MREVAEPGLTVLDIGAGTCEFLEEIRKSGVYVDARIFGLDSSIHMLTTREVVPGIARVVGDAHHLPLGSGSVDRVIGRQILHYLEPHAATSELRRTLRPGGFFHSTQQVDYDEVPYEWYVQWSALRNSPTRRRLSDADVTRTMVLARFREIRRVYVPLQLSYSWMVLAYKYGMLNDIADLKGFFDRAPDSACRAFDIVTSRNGVRYTSRFRLSTFQAPLSA